MSRSISISYENEAGQSTHIEIEAPYYLLGSQKSSLAFWSLPKLQELGLSLLTTLGYTDPAIFWGWEDLEALEREIDLLSKNLPSIDFDRETKVRWLSHLIYCYRLLVETAPKDSVPCLMIG